MDLGLEGYPFTWSNVIEGEDNIQAKLDWPLGNSGFINRFSPIKVTHLPRFRFDHAVLLIRLEAHWERARNPRLKVFRFEKSWSLDGSCEQVVREHWSQLRPLLWRRSIKSLA